MVALQGELDAVAVGEIEPVISDQAAGDHRLLVLDLTDLHFLDSTGIRMLIQLLRPPGGTQAACLVCPRQGLVWKALDVIGVTRAFPVSPTLSDALSSAGVSGGGAPRKEERASP